MEIVEQPTCTRPLGASFSSPPSSTTARTAASSESMVNTTSAWKASRAVPTRSSPPPSTGERFQARTRCPPLAMLRAIAIPIAPRPMKPTSMTFSLAAAWAKSSRPLAKRANRLYRWLPLKKSGGTMFQDLDAIYARFQQAQNIPGLVFGVIQDGKLAYVKGLGVAALDSKAPVQPETFFRIASMTKCVTALAVLLL